MLLNRFDIKTGYFSEFQRGSLTATNEHDIGILSRI